LHSEESENRPWAGTFQHLFILTGFLAMALNLLRYENIKHLIIIWNLPTISRIKTFQEQQCSRIL